MKRKTIFKIGIIFLLYVCNIETTIKAQNLYYYSIENEVLKQEIIHYIDTCKDFNGYDKILNVNIQQFGEMTYYDMHYITSSLRIVNSYGTIFAKVGDRTISVTFGDPQWHLTYEKNLPKYPEEMVWEYIKDIFKKEYQHYLKNGCSPLPPIMTKRIARRLIFIGNELSTTLVIYE